MSNIIWPAGFVPGFTDNFCSNEVIASGVTAKELWALLVRPLEWNSWFKLVDEVHFHDGFGPSLAGQDRFAFEIFTFPVEAEIVEFIAPVAGQAGRLAWHGWGGENESRMAVHHAWLIEDLSDSRVRILTKETQNGGPAKHLATTRPNQMVAAHQDWLESMVAAAQRAKAQAS